jgi:hypothetical protein
MASGALHGVLEQADRPAWQLGTLQAVLFLLVAYGVFRLSGTGRPLLTGLWALMAVVAGMDLTTTIVLAVAIGEDFASRESNTANAALTIVTFALVLGVAAKQGGRSMRHAFLLVAARAAVFSPTWPFLSPGDEALPYFIMRWVVLGIAVVSLVAVAIAFKSFEQYGPRMQRRIVGLLVALAATGTMLTASPYAFTSRWDNLVVGIDFVLFQLVIFGLANGFIFGVTWLIVRSRAVA